MRSSRMPWMGLVLSLTIVVVVGTVTTVRRGASPPKGADVEQTTEGPGVSKSAKTVPTHAAETVPPAERTTLYSQAPPLSKEIWQRQVQAPYGTKDWSVYGGNHKAWRFSTLYKT